MPSIPDAVRRAGDLLGRRIARWRAATGGYTGMERWVVWFDDGTSVFAKGAAGPGHAEWLRTEWHVYQHLRGDFMPAVIGWEDGDLPLLLLEDLHDAHWPPPWEPDHIGRVLATLEVLRASPHPPDLPRLESYGPVLKGWAEVARSPDEFLSLGWCSREWLERVLPDLVAADERAVLEGDDLLHFDIRSDNICFTEDRCVLVDWNWACVGNGVMDIAAWLPSLEAEGGPRPDDVLPDEPEMAALMSGWFAKHAGKPPTPGLEAVRALHRKLLPPSMNWAIRALNLPEP